MKKYGMNVGWNGETFEATVPDLKLTVTGATYQEAMGKALESIDQAQAAAIEATIVRRRQIRKRTVA